MKWLALLVWLAVSGCLWGQSSEANARRIEHFEVKGRSRLVALASLGGAQRVSLLVEAGDLDFLQQPVTLSIQGGTLVEALSRIVSGPEEYAVISRGALLVLAPSHPARAVNRLLTLPLGSQSFQAKSISDLDPYLGFLIEVATGCNLSGFMWAGPSLNLDIPPFSLPNTTFEEVVENVAKAPEPTMWVVAPDSGIGGCLRDPSGAWQVGFYNYKPADTALPFRQWAGPELVK